MRSKAYQDMELAVARWCQSNPAILAAIIIGSRGRLASPVDQYSDLDLILFTTDVDRYEKSSDWLNQFGELWITKLNRVGPGDPEWITFFAPGIKVDFLLVRMTGGQSLAGALDTLPYQQVLTRGFRLLYDSKSISAVPVDTSASHRPSKVPTQQEFYSQINGALFTAERFVKFSMRGDAWRALYTFHAELMSQLLAFIEWHSNLVGDASADTWYEGRYLEDWADSRVIDAMPQLTPGIDRFGKQDALRTLLNLMEMLASETALQLGYPFPTDGQRAMIAWLISTMHEPF